MIWLGVLLGGGGGTGWRQPATKDRKISAALPYH